MCITSVRMQVYVWQSLPGIFFRQVFVISSWEKNQYSAVKTSQRIQNDSMAIVPVLHWSAFAGDPSDVFDRLLILYHYWFVFVLVHYLGKLFQFAMLLRAAYTYTNIYWSVICNLDLLVINLVEKFVKFVGGSIEE